jgi:hypothetical protein
LHFSVQCRDNLLRDCGLFWLSQHQKHTVYVGNDAACGLDLRYNSHSGSQLVFCLKTTIFFIWANPHHHKKPLLQTVEVAFCSGVVGLSAPAFFGGCCLAGQQPPKKSYAVIPFAV